jgi:uncharacterized protein YuzE
MKPCEGRIYGGYNIMIFQYYPETDMLYIELARSVSTESEEVAPNIVLDFDENNQVIGIEIEDASKFIELSRLELTLRQTCGETNTPQVNFVLVPTRGKGMPARTLCVLH